MPRMTWIFQGRRGTPKRPPILMKIHRININTKPHHQLHEQVDRIKMKVPLGTSRTLVVLINFTKLLVLSSCDLEEKSKASLANEIHSGVFVSILLGLSPSMKVSINIFYEWLNV